MGLFDDILKKPNPPVGQVSPPVDPLTSGSPATGQGSTQTGASSGTTPVIVKSETSTVFGPNSEAEAIRSQNAPPSAPTVHAEEDASSVLMPANQQASAPIAPVAPPQEPMVVTPVVENVSQAESTSLLSEAIDTNQSVSSTGAQGSTESAVAATVSTSDALNIPQGPSLFDHIMNDETPVTPVTPAVETPVAFGFEAPSVQEAALEATPETKANVQEAQTVTETTNSPSISSPTSPMTVPTNYSTPREFIEKSLDNIEVMLETIDERHSAKMTEAEGYRMEKMRFAELEKNAYAEAEIMDRERDHTLRMKAIFEKELDTDEANRTRKTLAHQEAHVEKHAPHAHSTHRHHAHEEEEDLVAAS